MAEGVIRALSRLSNWAERIRSMIASCRVSVPMKCSLRTRRISRRSAYRANILSNKFSDDASPATAGARAVSLRSSIRSANGAVAASTLV